MICGFLRQRSTGRAIFDMASDIAGLTRREEAILRSDYHLADENLRTLRAALGTDYVFTPEDRNSLRTFMPQGDVFILAGNDGHALARARLNRMVDNTDRSGYRAGPNFFRWYYYDVGDVVRKILRIGSLEDRIESLRKVILLGFPGDNKSAENWHKAVVAYGRLVLQSADTLIRRELNELRRKIASSDTDETFAASKAYEVLVPRISGDMIRRECDKLRRLIANGANWYAKIAAANAYKALRANFGADDLQREGSLFRALLASANPDTRNAAAEAFAER